MNTSIIIPARLNSTRLPRKILIELEGKPIIQHVYERCLEVCESYQVCIAVDDEEVYSRCMEFCDSVFLTSSSHISGTDRIAEVAQSLDCEHIINVQGDEPFIDPETIRKVSDALHSENTDMATARYPIDSRSDFFNENIVKVVADQDDFAMYFSRSPIPFFRDGDTIPNLAFRHVGIYGYTREALLQFVNTPEFMLENIEKLEQLRALSIGLRIKVVDAVEISHGIDTIDDLHLAQEKLRNNSK